MGCDIHLVVEVRRNGKWEREYEVPEQFRDPEYADYDEDDDREWINRKQNHSWYSQRNYRMFAILAGVRDRDVINPIALRRGIPIDASNGTVSETDGYYDDIGEHSFSWLLLSELLAFNWDQEYDDGGTYREQCNDFCSRLIPALQTYGNPEDVRIVFGFDS